MSVVASVPLEAIYNNNQNNQNKNVNKEDNKIKEDENKNKQINENQTENKEENKIEKKYTYEGITPQSIEVDKNDKNENPNNFLQQLSNIISNTEQKNEEDNNDFNLFPKNNPQPNNNENNFLNGNNNNNKNENKNIFKDDDDDFIFQKVKETNSLFEGCSLMDSVPLSEELPSEIHNHSLDKKPLNDEICTICLYKKTCENGYKCELCPLIMCDDCSTKIRLYHISKNKHEHALCLLNEEDCICSKCNKELHSKKNYYFNCLVCKYYLCLNCYFPERKKENDNSPIHEHPLKNMSELKCYCQICEKETNSVIKCSVCELTLCQECWNNIISHKKNNNLHEHPLFLIVKKYWTCAKCDSYFNETVSFNCNKCNKDFCVECFLD